MPKIDLEEQLKSYRGREPTQEERQRAQTLDSYDEKLRAASYATFARHHPNVVDRFVETLGIDYVVEQNARINVANLFGVPSLDFATGGIPAGVTELYGYHGPRTEEPV